MLAADQFVLGFVYLVLLVNMTLHITIWLCHEIYDK